MLCRCANLFRLIFTAGYVSTDYAWKVGYTYTYDVRGRVLTGLSQHTQYSGLQVEYQMQLTVVGPETIHLKVRTENVCFREFVKKTGVTSVSHISANQLPSCRSEL